MSGYLRFAPYFVACFTHLKLIVWPLVSENWVPYSIAWFLQKLMALTTVTLQTQLMAGSALGVCQWF
jgi:hypothetical protein